MEVTARKINPYRGLMFRRRPKQPVCFPCNGSKSLHTWFVFYRIDVVFLNAEGRVIGTIYGMRPFSSFHIPRNTSKIVEYLALPFKIGDNIELEEV